MRIGLFESAFRLRQDPCGRCGHRVFNLRIHWGAYMKRPDWHRFLWIGPLYLGLRKDAP